MKKHIRNASQLIYGWVLLLLLTGLSWATPSSRPAHKTTTPKAKTKKAPLRRIQFKVSDAELRSYLTRLIKSVEAHDWKDVLGLFDPTNWKQQFKMGVKMPQYIQEGLGLGMVKNHLIPTPGDRSIYSHLNSIKTMIILKKDPKRSSSFGSIVLEGKVVLFNGSTRKIDLYIVKKKKKGGYHMAPPVG